MTKTAIILCSYNGDKFLQDQLNSFASQKYKNWALFVYDDGSKDDTYSIIERFKNQHIQNAVHWNPNERQKGFAQNFINGIMNTPDEFDFYALSDQDDIWCEDKLMRAEHCLSNIPSGVPAVYCSRTTLIDQQGKHIGLSPLFKKPPSFQNAFVQSIAGGNTMILNKEARELITKAKTEFSIVSHDWLIYQLVTGVGGQVHYDDHPEILYRQHDSNIIGSNLGLIARLSRMTNLLNGSFRAWIDKNILVLQNNRDLLISSNQSLLDRFIKERKRPFYWRIFSYWTLGLYRQTFIDNLALYFSWVLGKL